MRARYAVAPLVSLALLAACGGGSDSSTQVASGEGVLAGVCPDNVVFQTD